MKISETKIAFGYQETIMKMHVIFIEKNMIQLIVKIQLQEKIMKYQLLMPINFILVKTVQ